MGVKYAVLLFGIFCNWVKIICNSIDSSVAGKHGVAV